MKIVNATLSGEPCEGDVVMLHYTAPRGGRTTAGHVVGLVEEALEGGLFRRRVQTLEEIVDALAKSGEQQYCGARNGTPSFHVKPRGRSLRVECKDEVDDVSFVAEIKSSNGAAPGINMELIEL